VPRLVAVKLGQMADDRWFSVSGYWTMAVKYYRDHPWLP